MKPSDGKPTWIAKLHVRPMRGRTGGLRSAAGAYAIVLAMAEDEAEYRELVAAEMDSLGLFIAEIEDLERYNPSRHDSENVRQCARNLSSEWPVQYHDFHTYPHDEA